MEFEIALPLKRGPYSPSRMDAAVCPYHFKESYINKNPKGKIEDLPRARGSAVHEIFEIITKDLIKSETVVYDDVKIRSMVTEAVNRHPAAYQEVQEIINMVKLYLRTPPKDITPESDIELKLAIRFKLDANGKVDTYEDEIIRTRKDGSEIVEKVIRPRFEACGYDDKDAVARGRADILTISDDMTTAFIYDHKTQMNVEDSDTFQLGFYAWVISQVYPFIQSAHTTLHFCRFGLYSQSYEWDKTGLYEIESEFLARIAIIESRQNHDVAVANKNCQYCPYMIDCPIMKEYFVIDKVTGKTTTMIDSPEIIGGTDQAVKIAGLVHAMDEYEKDIKKNLKKHVQNFGPVAIPGIVFDIQAEEKVDWDKVNKSPILKEKIWNTMKSAGLDPLHFMNFSDSSMNNFWLIDARKEAVEEVGKNLPRKVATTFKGRKA